MKGDFSDSLVVRISVEYCYLTENVKGTDNDHEAAEVTKTSMTVLVIVESLRQSI